MKRLHPAQLVLCSLVIGTLFAVAAAPAAAVIPVTVDLDLTAAPAWVVQAAHMVAELDNQYQQITDDYTRINQEVKELQQASTLSLDRSQALSAFTSEAVALTGSNPSSAAAGLAYDVIHGQAGSIQPNDLSALAQEVLGAQGALQAHAAQDDSEIAVASQLQQLETLDAQKIIQEQADVLEAQNQQKQMMDLLSQPTANFSY